MMTCACSSPPSSAYGRPIYFPAGTTARFRFYAKQTPTGQPYDLTDWTPTLYLKTAETVDDSTDNAYTVANGGLEIMDAALGIFDWLLAPGDTSPADYTPGSPWFRYVKISDGTDAYNLAGSAGEVYLDATAPAVGTAGVMVAYSPACTIEAIGPDSSPLPAYATTAYVVAAVAAEAALRAAADAAAFGRTATTNAAGNSTLSIPAARRHHIEIITVSGSARTSVIILPVADRADGDVVKLRLVNTVSGVALEVRNATSVGTVLKPLSSGDGNAALELYFDGTAWQLWDDAQPVT